MRMLVYQQLRCTVTLQRGGVTNVHRHLRLKRVELGNPDHVIAEIAVAGVVQ